MYPYLQRSAWMGWSIVLCVTTAVLAQSETQPAAATQPSAALSAAAGELGPNVGVVKGNNVYIRSGFNTNYYPVIKLNRGDRVKIAGEEFGWLKIDPPQGTFSLVDKNFIDKVGDKKGIANGTAQVYAGSNMDERRYAKQVKLSKGTEVVLLGETSDGAFYKIEPPPGSHVWIKGEFVERGAGAVSIVKEGSPALETVKPGELGSPPETKPEIAQKKEPAPTVRKRTVAEAAPLPPAPSDDLLEKYQMQINAIETEIAAEGTKPLAERQFEPIIRKLQPIADQTEDDLSQIYARKRIEGLRAQMDLAKAVRDVSELRSKAIATADEIAKERQRIQAGGVRQTDTIVVRGQIAASGIYNGTGNLPKRWRVIDTASDPKNPNTIAYLEVPEGSSIDPARYYGQHVGIKATSHKILRGTIPPVPIYTVREIVMNPPPEQRDEILSTKAQSASPVPVIVSAPTSQPSGAQEVNIETIDTRPARK